MKTSIVPSMTTKMTLEMTNSKQDFVQIVESISREGTDFKPDQNNHIKI
jgi:hypothetical protein